MGPTALVVLVPEADPAVGEVRLQRDSSAARGVPAHVTVVFPFLDAKKIDSDALRLLFSTHMAFDFALDRVERWADGIVWLHPEPSEPFVDLTVAVWRRWPECPPYAGVVEGVIPHLTVSETPVDLEVDLPIASRASHVTLIEENVDGSWATRETFPLG
jgi:hypothetical protein